MAWFELISQHIEDGSVRKFFYNNETSEFTDDQGRPLIENIEPAERPAFEPTSIDGPKIGKSSNPKKLKIQLGLSCNYSCEYCSQRFVPHAEETNKDDVNPFLEQLSTWFDGGDNGKGAGVRIEFWGGEPFVYWKTLKPLAEALRVRYPDARLSMVTNGSLLSIEKNEWLQRLEFSVGLSHDGPGYHVRGLDPLDDPEQCANIKDLWARLGPRHMSFNAMLHKGNASRAEVSAWLVERLGNDVVIGEGLFIDAYDEGGLAQSMPNAKWSQDFAKQSFLDIRSGDAQRFVVSSQKIVEFVKSIRTARQASSLGQKCGMDSRDNIALDLRGNVLTCQNLSANSMAPNGQSHHIGHVSDLANVKLNTSTHWSKRENCTKCPVLQLCKGSCMFLEGERWEASCNSAYYDNVAFLAAAVEVMTGYIPVFIEGPQPASRKDLFGFQAARAAPAETAKPARKVFPIRVVTG